MIGTGTLSHHSFIQNLVLGVMATSPLGLGQYFTCIALASTFTTLGVLLQFKDRPPTPPSMYVWIMILCP